MKPTSVRALLFVSGFLVFQMAAGAAAYNVISNGGFETNGGANSSTFGNWTVAVQPGSKGQWYAQTGTLAPVTRVGVAAPPEFSFAAMTDGSGPGTHVLLQTFTVPAAGSAILTFRYFRLMNTTAPGYATPNSLDYTQAGNQQVRVDILTGAAGPFDLGGSVVLNAFQTLPGDSRADGGYQTFSMDIGSAIGSGGTFQLRIAEVDNLGQFQFGIDNVAINYFPYPDLTISKTHAVSFNPGDTSDKFTITVTNIVDGSVTSGTVTVMDSLPSGLTPVSIGGTGWACAPISAVPLSCSRTDSLAGIGSYPPITVTVSVPRVGVGSTLINTATVTGGGEVNTSNDTAMDDGRTGPGPTSVTVTISTSTPGLTFTVDGTGYTTSVTQSWIVGSTHTVATTTPQIISFPGKYVFQSWSDGGAISHTVTASAARTSLTATFTFSPR